MLPVGIRDGRGSGREAGVTANNALRVAIDHLRCADTSTEDLTALKQYRSRLMGPGGVTNLNLNGSLAAPITCSIDADAGRCLWITGLRIVFNDAQMDMNGQEFRRFGDAAAAPGLTNGLLLFSDQGGVVTQIFDDPVKNIGAFLNYTDQFTNLVNAIAASTDFLSFSLEFPTPIVIPNGTTDRIVLQIRDNLTAVDLISVFAIGYQETTPHQD